MFFSFTNQASILNKRFWIFDDKTEVNVSLKNDQSQLKSKDNSIKNCKPNLVKSALKHDCNDQKHRKSGAVNKLKCFKLLTFATNLTLIIICVASLSDRVYKCFDR